MSAPKPTINLDDDDDLPPPPVKATIVLDDDSGDDLPPPPVKPAIVLDDDDDDDLPPPPNPSMAAPPGQSKPVILDDSDDDLPAPPRPRTQHINPQDPDPAASAAGTATTSPQATAQDRAAGAKKRRAKSAADLSKEGFLLKQQPTWPYTSQKRWVVVKGRVMNYFENQGSAAPSGTLDLKGAELVEEVKGAKMPNSFGITGQTGQLKNRTYIFAPLHHDEKAEWVDFLTKVTVEPKSSDIHWFDKIAQGTF